LPLSAASGWLVWVVPLTVHAARARSKTAPAPMLLISLFIYFSLGNSLNLLMDGWVSSWQKASLDISC
jgi:hypothetical protein